MKKMIPILAAVTAALSPLGAQDAGQILERARMAATLQKTDLRGEIRSDRSREDTPVSLFLRGENIQFATGRGGERFHMRLSDDQYDLFEVQDNRYTTPFPDAKLRQRIAGSDLTYEDLSLRFLYWPNPRLLGEERVKTHSCWKIRVDNPGNKGNYSAVYVWVHQKFGAFMKVEGFDKNGDKLKQFTVEEVMKLDDDSYTVEKIKVSSYRGGRVTGNSYLEFDKPEKRGRPAPR